jgi:uncharacterized protein YndB with AHSA1/START domain
MTNEQTTTSKMTVTLEGDRTIVMERTVEAPRALVFHAYTDAEALAKWWGPRVFETEIRTLDVRPGGTWHYCMRNAEWGDAWGIATYVEVAPPERLVYIDAFSDEAGTRVPPEAEITVTFTEIPREGGRARPSTLIHSRTVYASEEDRTKVIEMGMEAGMAETLDRLDELMAVENAERGYTITRTFEAPRDLVWEMWTKPEHFAVWFGTAAVPVSDVSMDVREGGEWRATMHVPDHGDMPWIGTFLEVAKPEHLVMSLSEQSVLNDVVEVFDVTLMDLGGSKTEMVLRQRGGNLSDEEYEAAQSGTGAFIEEMAALLGRVQGK